MIERNEHRWIITFALIFGSVLVNASTDMYIPCLPSIRASFGVSEEITHLTLSMNMLGSGLGAFFYGPLADFYGRRRILLLGMMLFLIGTISCALSDGIYSFIVARFCQGLGGVSSSILWITIVRDMYTGRDLARLIGIFGVSISLALSLAPILGTIISSHFAWKGIFIFISGVAIVHWALLYRHIPETLKENHSHHSFKWTKVGKNYLIIFGNLKFWGYGLIYGLILGNFVGYVSTVSYLFIEKFSMTKADFAQYQFIPMVIHATSAWISRSFVTKHGMSTTFRIGLYLGLLGAALMAFVAIVFPNSPLMIIAAFTFYTTSSPFMMAVVTTRVMEIFPTMGGTSSSALTCIRNFLMAGIVFNFAWVYHGSAFGPNLLIVGSVLFIYVLYRFGGIGAKRHQPLFAPQSESNPPS